ELPTVEHELAVDEQTEAVIRAHRKLVAARDRGHELSGPPNAEVVAAYRIRREFATRDQVVDRSAAIPTERHSPVDPRHHRRAGQILALEILALEALLVRAGGRSQVRRLDHRCGARLLAAFDEIGAARIEHLRIRTGCLADALQNRDGSSRRAVVI